MAINSDSSFTFGFYNSINHDRAYNAEQMSTIFNGIINDGVFQNIGNYLVVKASAGMVVTVDTGRAWFDGTWSNNDALYPLTVEPSELILDRIDAVVLQVDHNDSARENKFMIVKGTPSSTPVKPTLINEKLVKQMALAYITVKAGVTSITDANIANAVGTTETPFITSVLKTANLDTLLGQWRAQLDEFTAKEMEDFTNWFQNVQYVLSGDAAGKLQTEIDNVIKQVDEKINGIQTISYQEIDELWHLDKDFE